VWPHSLTEFLAAWGAILATLGFGWNLYRDLLDRASLQVSATVRRIAFSTTGQPFAVGHDVPVDATRQLFVVMTVVNVGRRPVMWKGWGGKYRKRENNRDGFVVIPEHLPKMLQEGEMHSEVTTLDAGLSPVHANVRKLYMWDSSGRQYSLSRRRMRRLRQEAREATRDAGLRAAEAPRGEGAHS
jgi:hypothetical protein